MDEERQKITIHCRYRLGDIVFMKVRTARDVGMVTAVTLRPDNCIMYGVTFEDGHESTCYEIELTDTFVPDFATQPEE